MKSIKCRLIQPTHYDLNMVAFWDGQCGEYPFHTGRKNLEEKPYTETPPEIRGMLNKYHDHPAWSEMVCERCGCAVTGDLKRSASWQRRYNTASGRPEPGDMYWVACIDTWLKSDNPDPACTWTNCDGRHLHVVLPDGTDFDIESRANNCTLKDDRTHRCWVRVGEPPNVHISKQGHTCSAGAGSIATSRWHGFLRHGELVG